MRPWSGKKAKRIEALESDLAALGTRLHRSENFGLAIALGMHLVWSDLEACFILIGAEEPGSINKSRSASELVAYFLSLPRCAKRHDRQRVAL